MSNKKDLKDLKIGILYDHRHGRNDGPPRYYLNAMEGKMKLNCKHLIPGEPDVDKFGPMDLWFWIDWGEDAVLGRQKALDLKIPDDGGKKIYVVSDAHLDDGYRFEKAKQFDYVFFNQKHYSDEFLKAGIWDSTEKQKEIRNTKGAPIFFDYLPHAAEPDIFFNFCAGDMAIVKKYDLCFIGHIQEYQKGNGVNLTRIEVLDHMFKAIPNFYFGTRMPQFPDKNMFKDAAKKFCQSKIVFNISIGNDVNMRFFEALSTGSFLLTNWIPELKNLEQYGFKEGVHYVCYSTLDMAVAKAEYFIKHDQEREQIATVGHQQFLKTGTYEARIKEILDKIGIPITTVSKK